MVKLRRGVPSTFSNDTSLRLRAAWLYHSHGLTQSEVAEQLGIGRSTVIRLLDEARERGEVKIWIAEGGSEPIELALRLERALNLDEAIVVPASDTVEHTAKAVGLALGKFLSETVADDMTIGVGWGRTLTASLESFYPPKRSGVRVLSLFGGTVETQAANTFGYAWRLATALNAECFLFPAPLIVDSAETRQHLMEHRGIKRLTSMAAKLDVAVVSAGDISTEQGSLGRALIEPDELAELLEMGCVADIMCNFLDRNGNLVPHPLNERIMSVELDSLRRARHVVIANGGAQRAQAILAVARCIGCNTLVTDEAAAKAILALKEA
jgi:DNA-binding transcriptional regulator LsrR (DeoR family)